jgi:hypothetical protein
LAQGGLGHIGIQCLAALTATNIIVVDRHPDALKLAEQLGAHQTVLADGNQVDAVKDLTGGLGADVVLDFVAEEGAENEGFAMTGRAGSYFVIGYGGTLVVPTVDVVSTERNIVGNIVGTYNAELARFLRVADTNEWSAAWRLTASGLRRSEVLGLEWSAVDWASGSVDVRQGRVKTGRAKTTATDDPKSAASRRTVPVEAIHPGTIAALKALRSAQAEQRLAAGGGWDSGLVVVDAAGEGIHPDAYGERFRELCREAGVPVIRLHAVRHTLASALHDAGEPPAAVARLLGHTVGTHLQFYVRSTDDSANRAAVRFGGVLAAASS